MDQLNELNVRNMEPAEPVVTEPVVAELVVSEPIIAEPILNVAEPAHEIAGQVEIAIESIHH